MRAKRYISYIKHGIMMSLENYKTWSWVGILAGILVIVFTVLMAKQEHTQCKDPKEADWAFYANMIVAIMLIVAGGMALRGKSTTRQPMMPPTPGSISPDGSF